MDSKHLAPLRTHVNFNGFVQALANLFINSFAATLPAGANRALGFKFVYNTKSMML
jgi:hypothetical protein